jgi:hypothetical protein
MKMKKFNYLVLLCCLFITQGIFAQNMHRAVTIGTNVVDFVNKTVVLKNVSGDNEYYMLATYKLSGTNQKYQMVFIRLSSTFAVLDTRFYSYSSYDFYVNDLIVDPNLDFGFCGYIIDNGVKKGLIGKITGSSPYTMTAKYLQNSLNGTELTSIGYVPMSINFAYNYTGVYQYQQMFGKINNTFAVPVAKYYAYTGSLFTDNAMFVGNTVSDNRAISVSSMGNNNRQLVITGTNALFTTINSSLFTISTPYSIEGDAVIGKISANNYAVAIGIRDNSSPTSLVGFLLIKLYFNCSGGTVTINILDQKMYFFGPDKCLVTDICYDPDEMKICVSGRLIQSSYGRPYIAKINVADFTDASARYFAYGFTDNNTQGYDLNKIIYNQDDYGIVAAGNIRFTTGSQNAGIYAIEGYQSPVWESGTCGDEDLTITNTTCTPPVQTNPTAVQTVPAYTVGTIIIAQTTTPTATSQSQCEGYYGYSVHRPIHKIVTSENTEITILAKENNTLQIFGAETGSTYRLYGMTGNCVANGTIDANGLVGYDFLKSGMYVIAISNHNELLKTFKFIRL